MSSDRRLVRAARSLALALAAFGSAITPASAQPGPDASAAADVVPAAFEAPQGPPASASSRFLPRFDASFGWGALVANDRRFDWRGEVVVDFDVVDYGVGRAAFVSKYEAVLGRERRRYDLSQGNYFFEASGSVRTKPAEVVVFLQHVSRHVVDRENAQAISWNTYGVRARQTWGRRRGTGWAATRVEGDIEISRAMQQAFVDYRWLSHARARMTRPVSPRLAVVVEATGDVIRVDEAIRGRTRVCGGRIEGAVRIAGARAVLELFAGYERRIDAYPTDRFRVRWFTAGFRIANW